MNKRTIPYISGDGVGPEVTTAMKLVLDAALSKACGGESQIEWLEVPAGKKAFDE